MGEPKPKFFSMDRIKHDLNKAKSEIKEEKAKQDSLTIEEKQEQALNTQDKFKNAGKRMQIAGLRLTAAITLPLFGFIFLGFLGLIIGFFIGGLIFFATRSK